MKFLKPSHPSLDVFKLDIPRMVFIFFVHLMVIPAFFYFSWQGLVLMFFLHWLTGSVGICLTYHRLLSHRSLSVPPLLEKIFTVIGSLALQGGPLDWVSGHRKHHSFVEDVTEDPYSSTNGFWWSHMTWLLFKHPRFYSKECHKKYCSDLIRVPFYVWLEKYYFIFQYLLLGSLYVLGEFAFDHLGLSFVLYGFFLRIVFVWHCTWFVNSACHKWGYRNFDSNDRSRNLWWVSLFTYGEGWHNNHHTWAKCAKSGIKWWEIDPTWFFIKFLKFLGLARNVTVRKSK